MNLPEALSRQVERVTRLDAVYAKLEGEIGVNVKPARALIRMALDRAHEAAGTPDIQAQATAYKELEGFE